MERHKEWELLSAFADGELGKAERARVEGHLTACPSCRAELEGFRSVKAAVSSLPRRAMPRSLAELAADRLSLPEARSSAWRSWLGDPVVWLPAGALAAVAFWAAFVRPTAVEAEVLPLEELVASHARCSAESIVPSGDLVAAEFSSRLQARLEAPRARR